jgi:hypothetical protein
MKFNRRFGGTCRLHLQGRRISQSRITAGVLFASSFHACFMLALFFDPEAGGDICLRNYPFIFLQELRKTTRKFSPYKQRQGRDSNQTHPKVSSVTAELTCSTNHFVSTLVAHWFIVERANRSCCKYHIAFEV